MVMGANEDKPDSAIGTVWGSDGVASCVDSTSKLEILKKKRYFCVQNLIVTSQTNLTKRKHSLATFLDSKKYFESKKEVTK